MTKNIIPLMKLKNMINILYLILEKLVINVNVLKKTIMIILYFVWYVKIKDVKPARIRNLV